MTRLSVNVNKIALLRNARDGGVPNLGEFVEKIIALGCGGVTLHPRQDERHITLKDIGDIAKLPGVIANSIVINVEGDLREEIIDAVLNNAVHQFTVVPIDDVEQKTTERGWRVDEDAKRLKEVVARVKGKASLILFIEPEEDAAEYAYKMGFDGIEVHTKWYAKSFDNPRDCTYEIERIATVSKRARDLGLCVHLGHDLNLKNIHEIVAYICPDEISVGHHLISESLLSGIENTINAYKKVCNI